MAESIRWKNNRKQVLRGTGCDKARELNPIMGWWHYRDLTDDDLKAMFACLRTLKPLRRRVDNTEPPTLCKLGGGQHGLGDKNWPGFLTRTRGR